MHTMIRKYIKLHYYSNGPVLHCPTPVLLMSSSEGPPAFLTYSQFAVAIFSLRLCRASVVFHFGSSEDLATYSQGMPPESPNCAAAKKKNLNCL